MRRGRWVAVLLVALVAGCAGTSVEGVALGYGGPPGADAPSYLAGEELSMTSRSLAVLRRRA